MTHRCHYCTDTLEQGILYPVEVETPAFLIPNDSRACSTFDRKEGTQYPTQTVGRYKQCLACPTCIRCSGTGVWVSG